MIVYSNFYVCMYVFRGVNRLINLMNALALKLQHLNTLKMHHNRSHYMKDPKQFDSTDDPM